MEVFMRTALYARTSTTNNQSCERQLYELRQVAENHGWNVVGEYIDEGKSGAKKHRPELDRMMKDAMSRKFEMVATLELSRLGRSVKNMCDISHILKQKKIHLFVKNQNIDTSTIVGDFFFNILNALSQYERDIITERIQSGIQNARRKGKTLGRPTNLTDKVREQIIALRKQGVALKRIAKDLKVGVRSVYKVLEEHPC